MRRLVTVLVIAVASLPNPAQAAAVSVLVVDGRGFGHGVGMAQDGAYWMGAAGARTEEILGHFYPGTALGRGEGAIRVAVGDAGQAPTSMTLGFPSGGEVRDGRGGEQSAGFPVKVAAGGQVRVVWDGHRYRIEAPGAAAANAASSGTARTALASATQPQLILPTTTTTTPGAPPPSSTTTTSPPVLLPTTTTTTPGTTSTTAPPSSPGSTSATTRRPVWAIPAASGTVELPNRQRRYRGVMEMTAASGALRAVNEVDIETYLKGMGEVRDPRWPPAALRAQAIAARTYGLRAMLGGGEICDTQRCQVYLGAQAEYDAMNKAVDATRGQVLTFGRSLASAVYSANGGGHSASREEGFGVADDRSAPYLRPAPYLTRDPSPWSVTVALDVVAARLGYRGTLADVTASRVGPSGRVIELTLHGSAGPTTVAGIAFDAALGLKSTLFTVRVELSDVAPPPPPPAEELIQTPPDQAAAPAVVSPIDDRPIVQPKVRIEVPRRGSSADEIAAVFGTWALLAAVGGAVLALQTRTRRETRY